MHVAKKGKLTLSVMRNGIIDSVVFPETAVILRYSMKLIQINLFSNYKIEKKRILDKKKKRQK